MPIQQVLSTKEAGTRVPVKIWTDENGIEDEAKAQLVKMARLPFVFKHVAAMPDVHAGFGSTIGSVIATKGAVIPGAVGVDIGCGMMAVKTPLALEPVKEKAQEIRKQIERCVPVGFNQNKQITKSVEEWPGWKQANLATQKFSVGLQDKAYYQLGSLGGGNHFIEVCEDTEGAVWVMLHSGSRGFGNKLAQRHANDAKGLMKRMFINLPDPDLAYFVQGTDAYDEYMSDLQWTQGYAFQNRIEMMDRVLDQLQRMFPVPKYPMPRLVEVNCHHNYAEMENHFGQNVLVTRKGAVRARKGDMGIIPGSMGAKSFIVEGKGNPDSFDSCSHGAGRIMSRGKARRTFTVADLEAQTAGVECRKDKDVLDEIPGAYKDIEKVMADQDDLVEIKAVLKQIVCVKG